LRCCVVALLRCCVVALLRCCVVALLRCCVVALLRCCVVALSRCRVGAKLQYMTFVSHHKTFEIRLEKAFQKGKKKMFSFLWIAVAFGADNISKAFNTKSLRLS